MNELHDWSVIGVSDSPYSAPKQCLRGKRKDGHMIRTSPIVDIDGNIITTRSGTQYHLMAPSQDYVEWCRQNNYHIPTEKEPIKCC